MDTMPSLRHKYCYNAQSDLTVSGIAIVDSVKFFPSHLILTLGKFLIITIVSVEESVGSRPMIF